MTGSEPLDLESLQTILQRLPRLTIGVLGDLFLDRYLDLDADLTEPSLETGLGAYQVIGVRSIPGAAGTVVNNLVALGVGRVCPIAVIGDDGEGYELRQALARQPAVDRGWLILAPDRRTPTYTKPMLHQKGTTPRELNRLDVKNRHRMPEEVEEQVRKNLTDLWPQLNALVVLDQVSEADCGVVTASVRGQLAASAEGEPGKFILADSRERIGLFRGVSLKPNRHEVLRAIASDGEGDEVVERVTVQLARRAGGWVFCTDGPKGIILASPQEGPEARQTRIPGFPVSGPIDVVGAGDSTSAGIVCAVASGASMEAAAAFGNLVASITVQQIGTTGTATPAQVRQRFAECMKDESASA